MMWNNVPRHCIFPSPLDHGVLDCIFVTTCRDKVTCHEKKFKCFFFPILSTKRFSHNLP